MTDIKPVYDESDIKLLNAVEHVRLRPGMYIGGKDARALHHLIYTVLDEAVDESLAGHCDHIWITLRTDHEIIIHNNGRGLSVKPERNGKTLLESLMTETGIQRINADFQITGGMRGNLVYAVNALSAEFKVESACEGFLWQQSYREGVPQSEVIQVRQLDAHEPSGLTITFRPDFTIFEPNEFDYELIANRARDLAYLLPITITLRDEHTINLQTDEYHFKGGLANFIVDLNKQHIALHKPVFEQNQWTIQRKVGSEYVIHAAVAFQYVDSLETKLIGFANTLRTAGGFHTDIIPTTLVTTINNRVNELKIEETFSVEEIVAGLTIVVHVIHPHPSYESQTDIVLLNPDSAEAVEKTIYQAFQRLEFEQFQKILEKLRANRNALQENEKQH
jgi:DNA gyrase subunit B